MVKSTVYDRLEQGDPNVASAPLGSGSLPALKTEPQVPSPRYMVLFLTVYRQVDAPFNSRRFALDRTDSCSYGSAVNE